MKALILDKDKNNETVVLREDGEILTLDCQGSIGETIELDNKKKNEIAEYIKEVMFSCACFAIVILATASYKFYCRSPYTYVSLDINPSVEYTLNRQGKVIDVCALNADGKKVLKKYNKKCKKYCDFDDAINETTTILYKDKYIKRANNYILMNISSDNEKTISSLENRIEKIIKKKGDKTLNLFFTKTNKKVHEKAIKLGISPGRYVMMEDIYKDEVDNNGDIPYEEEKVKVCQNDSVFSLLASTGRITVEKDKDTENTNGDSKKEKTEDYFREKDYNKNVKEDKDIKNQDKVETQENIVDNDSQSVPNGENKAGRDNTDKNGKGAKPASKWTNKPGNNKTKEQGITEENTDNNKPSQNKDNAKPQAKIEESEQ
ncbi:MAG: hypothetical protein II013_03050 [Lachnobacterium sp.]|nr:hypothetical protein [Lachnobacterium sp.]